MTITSIAYFVVVRRTERWPLWRALAVVAAFLIVDLAFLGANLPKLASGGTVPLTIGLVVFALMTIWWAGRRQLGHKLVEAAFPFEALAADLATNPPHRVPGTGVFLTANPEGVPPVLLIDDVMGELDAKRRSGFLPLLEQARKTSGQVFMTATEENWPRELGTDLRRWEIRNGTLQRMAGDPERGAE